MDRRHGTERAVAELVERLAKAYGCEVHLYAQRVEDLALDDPSGQRFGNTGAIVWHRVMRLRAPHVVQFSGWMACNQALRWWHTHLCGVKFDLVLSPGINCLDADVIIVHALFQRLIELSHEENAEATGRTSLLRRFHRHIYYGLLAALERRIYTKKNVSLATVSRRTACLLKRYFGREHVPVIPNCVDARQFTPEARLERRREARLGRTYGDGDVVLLLVGNDWLVKGLPAILSAIAGNPPLPFRVLVAGNDGPEPFQAMARTLGIPEQCRWEPPRPDVIDLYAAADIYVSPSLEDSFALPVAEAMACGMPVVTSSLAGVSELIRNEIDGFILGDPRDTAELRYLLERLYGDETLRRRIGENAAQTAREWTWDRHAAAVWELIETSATDRHRGPV